MQLSRKRVEQLWLIEYLFGILLHIGFVDWKFSGKFWKDTLICALCFYVPVIMLCFFGKYVPTLVEQIIFVVVASAFIVYMPIMVHSFSLFPLTILTFFVMTSMLFEVIALRVQFFISIVFFIISGVMVYQDASWCPSTALSIFYLGIFITFLAILVLYLMAASAYKSRKELEKTTREALSASRSKTTFLANMSHEIRTPMNAIVGMSELLLMEDMKDSTKEYINTIHNASKSLVGIINDILDFSKIDAGKMEILPEPYMVDSLIQDVSNIIETRLKETSVSFVVEADPKLPAKLYGDEGRVKQILINVLSNSVKHTRRGRIRLSVMGEARDADKIKLKIIVEDTGKGIPKEDIKNLFVAFSQADTKRNKNIEGTGLGLAITKQLCQSMDGGIEIESEYGKGTTVTIEIMQGIEEETPWVQLEHPEEYHVVICEPNKYYLECLINICNELGVRVTKLRDVTRLRVYLDEKKTFLFYNYNQCHEEVLRVKDDYPMVQFVAMVRMFEMAKQLDHSIITITRPFTISGVVAKLERKETVREEKVVREAFVAPEAKVLVVDDNAVNLKVAGSMLSLYQIQTSFATSGMECIKLLEEGKEFDIIFMDHMMPKMDGVETAGVIRNDEKEKEKKSVIVVLTANAIMGVEKMFLANGMDDYLSKPLELQQLDEVLRKWLPKELQLPANQSSECDNREEMSKMEQWKHYNVKEGIEAVGGMEEIYYDILETVLEEGAEKLPLIEKLQKEKDYTNYEIEVHGLKSAMAGVCCMDLSAMAKEHEFAVKEDRLSFVDEHVNELLELYAEVLEETKAIIASVK
ncbi:MAG: response regulator [Lachnospiraceae bacterium]|nr:response regulator [Lachnospiraceae bacterium]